jgi:uncharacterized protein (DUF1015 family)
VAVVAPLRGIRYDPAHVDLGRCLAPPYDVISDAERTELYARDLRNIVRVDYGEQYRDDEAGVNDRYTRATGHLRSWLDLGILRQDERPAVYVYDHSFQTLDGRSLTRRGLFLRVRALPWEQSDVIPHEHTLRGPKDDRLSLMRATSTQTSAVFLVWRGAAGVGDAVAAGTDRPPDAQAETEGEVAREEHRLWVLDDAHEVAAVTAALAPARLYMADGHHRFETAAAYAAERAAADPQPRPDADYNWTLAYACAADDPAIEILPTHRLVRPGFGAPDRLSALLPRLQPRFFIELRYSLEEAFAGARALRARDARHAFAIAARDGAALVHAARDATVTSPRARLDVSVVEDHVLLEACGIGRELIAGGALGYSRSVDEAALAASSGAAALSICVNPCTTREMIDVSDAGEQMPQKSTYFYPKIPTGLVLNPV